MSVTLLLSDGKLARLIMSQLIIEFCALYVLFSWGPYWVLDLMILHGLLLLLLKNVTPLQSADFSSDISRFSSCFLLTCNVIEVIQRLWVYIHPLRLRCTNPTSTTNPNIERKKHYLESPVETNYKMQQLAVMTTLDHEKWASNKSASKKKTTRVRHRHKIHPQRLALGFFTQKKNSE